MRLTELWVPPRLFAAFASDLHESAHRFERQLLLLEHRTSSHLAIFVSNYSINVIRL
ncbi:hypothetical protein [Bradyrhizobium sp. sBnM-33]|uniref:hypothetical protein n=1 Tax=Bradyrhizobium sp. sBnM-33 TaxID=2831780 RepID=UPI001BD05377|nr:hypothetical protein [Bradyrhizobium sp. sBnM-33]WOH52519.1 hypothetical protein RX328_10345 [Bradyrhizobium sp. sBnM-33]